MSQNRLHADHTSRFSRATAAVKPAIAQDFDEPASGAACYELRFRSLFDEGRGCAFPCDAAGHVDLDALTERARNSYFYAHTLIGRDFSAPAVQPSALH
jgi:hypothetical protein